MILRIIGIVVILAVFYFEIYTEGYNDGLRDASKTVDDLPKINL